MRFSRDLKNYADRGGCYRPRRIRSYESLAWDRAPQRGKKEKKIGLGEKKSREVVWGGERVFSYLTPFCAFFSPTAEPGSRLTKASSQSLLITQCSALCFEAQPSGVFIWYSCALQKFKKVHV